jgi:5-methyltetrahydropteroyltriglutamate--homocysteine methyltransferase
MAKLFPVQEIGSLAKPRWRTKGLSQLLTNQDLSEAEQWAVKLNIADYHDRAKQLLGPQDAKARTKKLLELSTIYGLRLFERAGLDNVGVGGEQQRIEMYEHVVRAIDGMRPLGHVQSFDNKYFNKAVAESRISRKHPIYLPEFLDVKKYAKNSVKVPITGAYTMADWSFAGYYRNSRKASNLKQGRIEGKREFLLDLVEQVIRPEIRDLVQAGAEWIQIDEPAVTTHPEPAEMDLFVESWNETVRGFNCKFSDHTCYPSEIGYEILSEYAPSLNKCSQLALEYANRDTPRLGTDDQSRIGYSDLKHFVDNGYEGEYGVGVVHVHDYSGEVGSGAGKRLTRDIIESPELIRDRLLYATKIVGEPEKIWTNPDCGLRTRTWDVTYAKLANIVEGARLARETVS